MTAASPFWHPDRHADRRPFLLARARILQALRLWFAERGFIEVETATLQNSPGNEAHLHAFATELVAPAGGRASLYLRTSPEFACKKLLAAGERRIFEVARAFRNRERGPLHHPEFTLLEWYRAGATYRELMNDCETLLRACQGAAGVTALTWRGERADTRRRWQLVSVAEAFRRHAGIDILATAPDPRKAAKARPLGAREN